MRDPITDVVNFLAFRPLYANNRPAATPWGPVPIVLFWVVAAAAVVIAIWVWKLKPEQRTPGTVYLAFVRFLLGVMWLQQTFWKLPPSFTDNPDGSGGLRQWMGFMADGAAFAFHRAFVRDVVLPNFHFFAYQVWAAETAVAVMLMLGLFTRLAGLLGLVMSLNLWLGLYNVPNEWSWSYAFMALLMGLMISLHPGRALGVDALFAPAPPRKLLEWLT